MDFAQARLNMVNSQILPVRITDAGVVDALTQVPREAFLPEGTRSIAYVDGDLPFGNGRHLMKPLVTAQLLQAARVQRSDAVLVVGGGTGYAAALLARMASAVVVLEHDAAMAARAGEALNALGVENVVVVEGPLADGYPRQAPYDVIVFDGAIVEPPAAILEQLAEGGRLVAVIDTPEGSGCIGRGTVIMRIAGSFSARPVFDARIQTLPGFAREPAFVF